MRLSTRVSRIYAHVINIILTEEIAGDAMVREMDFSKITLRIVGEADQKGEGKENRIKAKLVGNTVDTLRRCLVC